MRPKSSKLKSLAKVPAEAVVKDASARYMRDKRLGRNMEMRQDTLLIDQAS